MKTSNPPLIAFNAHLLSAEASYRSAGIAVYIANLVRHLARAETGLRYALLLGDEQVKAETVGLPPVFSRMSTRRPAVRILWEQSGLPLQLRQMQADLLHAPAFIGPLLSPCPQVITIHDLSFLRYPEYFRRGNRLYLRTLTGISCRRAAAVIAVSNFTATEAVKLLNVPADRVHTIYHGIDPRFRPLPRDEIERFRREKGLPERFVLHMGTLEPRKNIAQLVRAFALLRDPDLHLVLAGGRGWLYDEIFAEVERLGLKSRVHFPGYVTAEIQTLWYNAAHAFAYISNYEGFGFPVVEALACGTPTLTASTTSLPEAGGDGALTAPPDDAAAIAEGLHRLLTDGALRSDLRQRGLAHAAQFVWSETARQTAALYRQVIGAA